MDNPDDPRPATVTAFEGATRLAGGDRLTVALAMHAAQLRGGTAPVIAFDDATGQMVEFDLRGSAEDVARRLAPAPSPAPAAPQARGPGRPKLGVVAREVTLLPRHWDWLARQPGGASVAIRRLVEAARSAGRAAEDGLAARDAAYRFATAAAGDQPDFEEAMRALFARDAAGFDARSAGWAGDLAAHARNLAGPWFAGSAES